MLLARGGAMSDKSSGTVLTFYSYKGGTGRSMALANIAWLLASYGKKVLVIDWDLEAPGLHRYFQPFLIDPELTSSEGVIDFVWNLAMTTVTPFADPAQPDDAWVTEVADITSLAIRLDWDLVGLDCWISSPQVNRESTTRSASISLIGRSSTGDWAAVVYCRQPGNK